MYEKECDTALQLMGTGDRYYYGASYEDINLGFPDWQEAKEGDRVKEYQAAIKEHKVMKDAVFAILRAEGLIEYGSKEMMDFTKYFLTDKGKAFLATDSFVERAKRWELELKSKQRSLRIMEQEINLNDFQIKTKGWSFWISATGFLVSLAAFTISLSKCDNGNNNNHSSSNHASIEDSLINPKRHDTLISTKLHSNNHHSKDLR